MKKFLLGAIAVIVGMFMLGATVVPVGSVMAAENDEDNCTKTAILTEERFRCDEEGSAITAVLNLVVEIMTIGVGILGVLGITIVGVQYLTAGGNEEQTRKAKRRMFEIVIGIAAYVVIYALLYWLTGIKPFQG